MIQIRTNQLELFTDIGARNFENEMMAHSKSFAPQTCQALSDDELRLTLRRTIAESGDYGFSYRGPIRTYIELMLLFGSGFNTDPEYIAIRKILESSGHQMSRAQLLYDNILNSQAEHLQT